MKIKNSKGSSLLEVMVALVVMSMGLLGMVGLQVATSKYRVNVEAYGLAAHLFSSLTERIRINPEASGENFNTQGLGGASLYLLKSDWATQIKETIIISKDCDRTRCDSAERAAFDMALWRQRLRLALPQGSAIVDGNRNSGIDITLMWMDKEMTGEGVDPITGELNKNIKKFNQCGGVEQMAVYSCCPDIAAAPEGVRCLRMSFLP